MTQILSEEQGKHLIRVINKAVKENIQWPVVDGYITIELRIPSSNGITHNGERCPEGRD